MNKLLLGLLLSFETLIAVSAAPDAVPVTPVTPVTPVAPGTASQPAMPAGMTQEEFQAKCDALCKQIDALVPDVVATYGDDQVVTGATIRESLKRTISPKSLAQMTDPAKIRQMAQAYASMEIYRALQVKAALQDGERPDLEAARKQVAEMVVKSPKMAEDIKSRGLTEEQMAKNYAESEMLRKWRQAQMTPKVPEAELEKYYQEHLDEFEPRTIAHILAAPKKDPQTGEVATAAKEEAKKRIAAVLIRLQAGEEFSKLAQECSDCPSGKQNGGGLGRYTKNESPFPPEFNDVAFALKNNETSAVIETPFGFHLVRASGIPAKMPPQVRARILQQQYGMTGYTEMQKKTEALKAAANIKFNL